MPTALARPWPSGPVVISTPRGVPVLGVARGLRAPRAQRLEVVELEAVAGQVQLDVLRQAGVPAGQHEPVAAEPLVVGRVVPHARSGRAGRRRGPGSSPCRGGRCRPSGPRPRPARGRCPPRARRGRSSRPSRHGWARVAHRPGGPARSRTVPRRRCDVAVLGAVTARSTPAASLDPAVPASAPTWSPRARARVRASARVDRPCDAAPCRRRRRQLRASTRTEDAVTRPSTPTGAAPPGRPSIAAAGRRLRRRSAAYVALTKPRIIELLLVTTVPTMFLAARRLPPRVAGAGHARRRHAGGRQREHAELLPRPRHRRGHAPHRAAAARRPARSRRARRWSSGWCSASSRWRCWACWSTGCPRGSPLAAILFYVFVYTMLLKRRTPQNIVWGGAAGCMPVLIGWSAVTGSLSLGAGRAVRRHLPLDAAALLAAVDAVRGRLRRRRRADAAGRRLATSWWPARSWPTRGRWSLCSLLSCRSRPTGPVYAVAALVLGRLASWSRRTGCWAGPGRGRRASSAPMRLFHFSITYLTLLFVAVAVDPFVRF